jgi:ectoine hydroxylase
MQPEKILAHSPKVLTQAQRETYFETGYIALESYINRATLDRLWEVTNGFIDESRSWTESDSKFDLDNGHTADTPRLRRLTSPVSHHDAYWQFASDGAIADLAEDLLGPDVKFHHSKLNFKWSGGGEEVKWHQDTQFYPHTNYSVLAIGLYMNDVDDEMGPMGMIPGSHKREIYNLYNEKDQWTGSLRDSDSAKLPVKTADYLKGPAGTVTVHHCRTVHGSLPNNSNRSRPLLINAFSAADALECTPHPSPCSVAGKLIRGKPARWIHFDAEPNQIPPDWSGGYTSIFAAQQAEDENLRAAE